jgi:hypothetical protein
MEPDGRLSRLFGALLTAASLLFAAVPAHDGWADRR